MSVAVVGLGSIGLLHARHLARTPAARLARLVDADSELAEALAARLGVPWSDSYEATLSDASLDAVVIATPTPLHAAMTEQAAAAGKHVFCEKPLSLDVESGRAATTAAAGAGVALQVGFQRRFDPDFAAAKARVDAGETGALRLLRISHRNRSPPHAGGLTARLGSIFVDMTIHDFDTARWLGGEVRGVDAFDGDGASLVVVRFETGAIGVVDNTRLAGYGYECTVELMGERSTLRIGDGAGAPRIEQLAGLRRVARLPADHVERHRAAYAAELEHFVECVRTGSAPVVGGEDSVAALALSLAAERCVA